MAHGHDHRLALDQRLDVGFELDILDCGPPRRREPLLDVEQLGAQHLEKPHARAQDLEITGDLGDQPAQFLGDLFALQPGQPLQAQIEDRAGLLFRQPVGAVRGDLAPGFTDQRHQRGDIGSRPGAAHETGPRRRRVGRVADQRNHLVEIGDCDRKP